MSPVVRQQVDLLKEQVAELSAAINDQDWPDVLKTAKEIERAAFRVSLMTDPGPENQS